MESTCNKKKYFSLANMGISPMVHGLIVPFLTANCKPIVAEWFKVTDYNLFTRGSNRRCRH